MPSSIRSGTPRLANVRTTSSPSIHIDREVTVVTSATDGSNKRNVYRASPSVSNAHGRTKSSQNLSTAPTPAPVLYRWNSTSKVSDMSSRFTHERAQSSRGLTMMDSNRDSMRALAEFLKRSEPPPSNYMSRPDSDAGSIHSIKKPAFRIFGRSNTRKARKGPRLMRLPDSAVAAKTISGARHIAISIPLEHDYPYYEAPAPPFKPSRPHTQPKLSSERGVVTVLKPVAEVRESGSSFLTKIPSNEEPKDDKRISHAEPATTPAADVLGPETTRTLENYYTQLNRLQRNRPQSSKAEGKIAVRPDPTTTHRRYIAVTPVDTARQDGTRTEPRHSGGTAYSIASIGTHPAHSRGPSNASSAPSAIVSSMKLNLPPRKSSVTKVNPGIQTELAKAYLSNETLENEDPATVPFLSDKSVLSAGDSTATSGMSPSHSPPTPIDTAETTQSDNTATGLQTISRSTTPKASHPTSPAPTRQLPDVPESPCVPSFYPSPSPPISRKNSPTIGVINDAFPSPKSTVPTKSISKDSRQQSRQDRVKARKQRDIAVHRDKSATGEIAPLAERPSSMNPQILVTPPRSGKRGSISQDMAHRKALNSMTDIMLVADLAPYTGEVRLGDLPSAPERASKRRVKDSDSNGSMSARRTHTPPSSMESESDTIPQNRCLIRSRRSSKNIGLDVRRQERRMKRNMSLREKEMEARLGKIERDNAMLLRTLSGIANSFGELSRVLPVTRIGFGREAGLLTEVEREIRDGGDEEIARGELTRLGSVMQDLEFGAGKVSQENLKGEGIRHDYDH